MNIRELFSQQAELNIQQLLHGLRRKGMRSAVEIGGKEGLVGRCELVVRGSNLYVGYIDEVVVMARPARAELTRTFVGVMKGSKDTFIASRSHRHRDPDRVLNPFVVSVLAVHDSYNAINERTQAFDDKMTGLLRSVDD